MEIHLVQMFFRIFKPFYSITSTNLVFSKYFLRDWLKQVYMEVSKPLIFAIRVTYDKVYIVKLHRCAIEHVLIRKGQCLLIIWIMTLISRPQKIVTPSTPKHTTLLAMLAYDNPQKTIRERMITIVRLSNVPPFTIFSRLKKIDIII